MKFSEPEGLDQPQHTIRGEASKKEACSRRKDREIDREGGRISFLEVERGASCFRPFFFPFLFSISPLGIYLLSILLIRSVSLDRSR